MIDEAVAAVRRGELVVFPTETVYGIGCSAGDAAAVDAIFAAKDRPPDKTLQLMLASPDAVADVARVGDEARVLIDAFMPGPLTLVLPATEDTPDAMRRGDTVGVRVPDHPVARELLAAAGPMATTSANRSGHPTPTTVDGAREAFGDAVAVYLDGGRVDTRASTVVSVVGEPTVLREGVITSAQVAGVLGREVSTSG